MEVTELPKEKGRVLEFDAKIDKEAQAGVEIVMENISFSYQYLTLPPILDAMEEWGTNYKKRMAGES